MDDEFGAMAFGGFDDLWKRHGGKGALRHGGTVSMIEKFRTRLLTQPSRLIDAAGEAAVADDAPQGSLRFSELQSSRPQAPLTLA